jgi:hypothetical protein
VVRQKKFALLWPPAKGDIPSSARGRPQRPGPGNEMIKIVLKKQLNLISSTIMLLSNPMP